MNKQNEPQMKKELAVDKVLTITGIIVFYANSNISELLQRYGKVTKIWENRYSITVDKRYDFDEVIEYFENYNKDLDPAIKYNQPVMIYNDVGHVKFNGTSTVSGIMSGSDLAVGFIDLVDFGRIRVCKHINDAVWMN